MNTIEIINDLLKEKGISASKMMKDLGFSSGLFSQWKKGLQNPSRKKVRNDRSIFQCFRRLSSWNASNHSSI